MADTTNAVLTTHDLTIGYRRSRQPAHIVAGGISTVLHAGELVCLIGPNGVGKSTLMRTLGGMLPALGGAVMLGGENVFTLSSRELAHRMSVVLTERVHVGNLSAYGLAALGRHPYTDWSGTLSAHDEAVVQWAMEAVNATHLAACPVNELSDGERQKVMIARALAQEPVVMILDEPTAFLDLPNRVEVIRVLRHLTRTTGRAILLSTHDLDLALRGADTIWLMSHGAPLQVGAPEDLVLNGAFEAAFQSDGIRFDRQTGTFTIVTPDAGCLALAGDGLAALWTRHALEREGFRVVEMPDKEITLRVELITPNGHACWRLVTPASVQEYYSLHALLAALRQCLHS